MTALSLFGLSLAPLYAAIAQVESDRGATSVNVYQIRDVYIKDVNRIIEIRKMNHPYFTVNDKFVRMKAEDMMFIYWEFWGNQYQRETGCAVTYEVLARIHNGGPNGWRKASTVPYWKKVVKRRGNVQRGDLAYRFGKEYAA